jgi:hypothetical protein
MSYIDISATEFKVVLDDNESDWYETPTYSFERPPADATADTVAVDDTLWIGARRRSVPGAPRYELFVVNNDTYEGMCESPASTYPPMHNAADFNIPRSLLEEYIELAEEYIDAETDYEEYGRDSRHVFMGDLWRMTKRMEEIEVILGKLVVARDAAKRRRRQAILAWANANK